MATNAKEINELNAAASVGSTDFIPLSQSGGTEAVKATVEQVSSAVADVLSDGALAELEYATSQGKNAIATALTSKGVATTASETLIQMADKVNNLAVDNAVEVPSTVLQCAAAYTVWSDEYLVVQCNAKKYTAIAHNDTLYIHKWTSSTDQSNKTLSELTASDVSCPITGITLNTYTTMRISGDGSKIAIFEPDTTDGQKVSMFSYDEMANTISLLGTYNMNGYTANATQRSMGISNDGTLVFSVCYSKTSTGESSTNKFYLYDLTTNVESSFSMELTCRACASNANSKYAEIFSDGTYIYVISVYSSLNINKLAYTKNDSNTYTITQIGSISGAGISSALSAGRVSMYPHYKLLFLWGTTILSTPLGRFYSVTDPNTKNQIAVIDLETMGIIRSDGCIISATSVTPPAYENSGSLSNAGAQCYYIEETNTGIFDIHLPTAGITYTYNRTAVSLTHANTPIGIIYQNGVYYGTTQNNAYSGNYAYFSFGLLNFYEDANNVYITYLGEYRAPNADSMTAISYGSTSISYIRLQYIKNQKSAYIQIPDYKYMLQPNNIYVTNVASGYFNRATTITPAVPDDEQGGGSDPVGYYTWLKGTHPSGIPQTLYSKKSDGLPTLGSGFVYLYTDTACTVYAKNGGIYYGVKRNNTDDGYIIQNMGGTGESSTITLQG